jgi:hypothetical protein
VSVLSQSFKIIRAANSFFGQIDEIVDTYSFLELTLGYQFKDEE